MILNSVILNSVIRNFSNSVIRNSVIRNFSNSVIRNSVIRNFSSGFTLVELIVVIGIIGVLAGVLFASLSGGTDSARAARCLSNMRNLAAACQTYGAEKGRYPHAGSIEWMAVDESDGIARVKAVYHEEPGWISWNSKGAYGNRPTSHQASSAWMTSMYSDDDNAIRHAYTNGVLWKYVSGSAQSFVCPLHAKKTSLGTPHWSYLMNAYFGWDDSEGSEAEGQNFDSILYGHMKNADKVLLFSEVPFGDKAGGWIPTGTGSGTDCDCVLQFDTGVETKTGSTGVNGGSGKSECIGFNHKSGKETFANVIFADGHVEKLRLPKDGLSDGQLKELTAWLCTGTDVTFDGRQYQKQDN